MSLPNRIIVALLAAPFWIGADGPALHAEDPGSIRSLPPLPADPEPGKTYPLRLEGSNRGVRLSLIDAIRLSEYGSLEAEPGKSLLLLSTEWENTIPLALVVDQQLATTYKVPNLSDHLYLVADGRRLIRLDPRMGKLPGHIPVLDFSIEAFGDRIQGNLIFQVPEGRVGQLELRFYDFAHGHIRLALGEPVPAAPPPTDAKKNEVVSVAVYQVESSPEVGGQQPADGMVFKSVDLRAISEFTTDADASAFDSKAPPGRKTRVGTVADWKESRKYLQMVVDGEYAYAPLSRSDWADEPRFLPDLYTGGVATFAIPKTYTSLELRCDFPNARLPSGAVVRPAGISIPLEGERPAAKSYSPMASAKDAIFDVNVVAIRQANEFAGSIPPGGKTYLVAMVNVANISHQAEFFQPLGQLKWAAANGATSPADNLTFAGPHAPPTTIYIPAGETRSFELVYQTDKSETRHRIAYAAVSAGASKILELPGPGESPVASKLEKVDTPARTGTPPVNPAKSPDKPPNKTTSVAPVRVTARQDLEPRGLAGVGLTPEKVNEAIDRGSEALWELIRDEDLKQGSFGRRREHVLVALALVHSGAHKKIPDSDAALRGYLRDVKPRTLGVYQAGLVAMLVGAYGDGEFSPRLEEAARYLLESQGVAGTWTYTPHVPDEVFAQAEGPPAMIRVSGGVPLDKPGETWTRITPFAKDADKDNSVTQYALLGLSEASRAGVKVSPAAWEATLKETLARQEASGGWSYERKGSTAYGSMTAAGICAVAICRHELGEAEPAKDESVERGLGWLASHFSVKEHPGKDQWFYYYMYSLERVGRILDTEFIGTSEWYPLGAAELLSRQKGSGLWVGEAQEIDPRIATSFALLFLTRATPSLDLKPRRGGQGTLRTLARAPFQNYYIILDASGSMLDEMDGKMKFDIARDSVRALIHDLPPNSNVALRVYGHRKRATEDKADEDTELKIPMTPLDKAKFGAVLDALRARGKTPLALSMEQAIKDLGRVSPDKPVTLLLLTDGGEDTLRPRRDPLKSADLIGALSGVRFHVVGFDINQPEWTKQLVEIASRAHGQYWPAARAADLERGVKSAVLGVPESFTVFDPAGQQVAHGAFGRPMVLAEGRYRFQTMYAGNTIDHEFWINTGRITTLTFDASLAPGPTTRAAGRTEPAPEVARRFCTNCGAQLRPGGKFCERCGARVANQR